MLARLIRLSLGLAIGGVALAEETVISTETSDGPGQVHYTRTITTTGDPAPAHATQEVTAQSRAEFELFSGARFGGIIGASIVSSLTYQTHHAVRPELLAEVGISGTKLALGPRWSLRQQHWRLSAEGLTLEGDAETAIIPRAIACYRWEDEDRAPSIWRGIVGHDGWYLGAEIGVDVRGLDFDVAVTWRQDDPKKPQFTLAYGVDF